MESQLILETQDGQTEKWHSKDLSAQWLWINEGRTVLGKALSEWMLARESNQISRIDPYDGSLPNLEDMRPPPMTARFKPSAKCLFMAETDATNPNGYKIVSPESGSVYIRDMPSPLLKKTLRSDLNYCRGAQRPYYQQIQQLTSGVLYHYIRLLLPAVDILDDGEYQVTRIYSYCRPVSDILTQTQDYTSRELLN